MDTSAPAPPSPHAARVALAAAAAIALLAATETTVALVAPSRAPVDADWQAASREVRAGFRPGDLIVAAPAWADPILRVHLGDLIPVAVAARLDDGPFGRVWEISQRGARAAEARGAVRSERRFGALTVRLVERAAEVVDYDFVARWPDARVSHRAAAGAIIACRIVGDHVACPGDNVVRRQLAEVDFTVRDALLAQPMRGAAVVIDYPAVRLGRVLVVAAGLHNVWMRKAARGAVDVQVFVAGEPRATIHVDNDSGWSKQRIDTAPRAGQVAPVRFEITSPAPASRYLALAAEARR